MWQVPGGGQGMVAKNITSVNIRGLTFSLTLSPHNLRMPPVHSVDNSSHR